MSTKKRLSDNELYFQRGLEKISNMGILQTFQFLVDICNSELSKQRNIVGKYDITYEGSALQRHDRFVEAINDKLSQVMEKLYEEVKNGNLKL